MSETTNKSYAIETLLSDASNAKDELQSNPPFESENADVEHLSMWASQDHQSDINDSSPTANKILPENTAELDRYAVEFHSEEFDDIPDVGMMQEDIAETSAQNDFSSVVHPVAEEKEELLDGSLPVLAQTLGDLIPDNESGEDDFEGFEKDIGREADVDGMLNNIFGDSEEEEFEGFAETEVAEKPEPSKENAYFKKSVLKRDKSGTDESSSSGDEEEPHESEEEKVEAMNELELIIERRREENRRRKRRKDCSYINDSDDIVDSVIRRMREVAEEDREKVRMNLPATSKLRMLKHVEEVLQRVDLRASLIDQGVLSCLMDWLSPVKGNVLPSLPIRQVLLKQLLDFPPLDEDTLRASQIGKAIMYLSKHPDEKEENKKMCRDLIYRWSQTVFCLKSDYRALTREERVERDRQKLAKRRRTVPEVHSHRDLAREMSSEDRPLRPGEPGFIPRARVPQPSRKDYLVRPEWKVKTPLEHAKKQKEENGVQVETKTRSIERSLKSLKGGKRSRTGKSVKLSIAGREM